MSKDTRKKNKKKEKKKQKKLEEAQAQSVQFDIINLLKTSLLDTKPNVAKFLDTYVKDIRVSIDNGKIQFYPTLSYTITRVFVKFLDGHELIAYPKVESNLVPQYVMYNSLDEVELTIRQIEYVQKLFDAITNFGFIRSPQ